MEAVQKRQDMNDRLMADRQRDVTRWEARRACDEQRLAQQDAEVDRLKVLLLSESILSHKLTATITKHNGADVDCLEMLLAIAYIHPLEE